MATLPNMGLITPTLGADNGTWDDKINAAFGLIDAHDHTSGKGVQITSAAINIDADLSIGGFTLSSIGKLSFSTITAPASGSKNLFVNTADNELYWRTNSGTNVKLTNGTSINVSIAGGIAGDYASAGAEVAFDNTNNVYTFKDESSPTRKWMRMASGPVRIYEYNTTEAVYIEHVIDASLASSYTIIWPAALPATYPARMVINPSGAMEYKTDLVTDVFSAYSLIQIGSAHTLSPTASEWALGSSTNPLHCALKYKVGDVLSSINLRVNKASDTDNTLSLILVTYTASTGVVLTTQTAQLATNAPGAQTITLTLSPEVTIEDGKVYALQVTQNDASPSGVDKIFGGQVTFTRV